MQVGPRQPWRGLLGPACGIASLCVCVAAYADPPGPLAAHPEPPAPVAAPSHNASQDPKAARAHELEAVRAEQKRAADTEAKLRQDIATINENRRKLNEDLINTAARVRSLEERVSATEARLQTLGEQESTVKNSLQGRRGEIAKVLAALQRMGRRPPPAILVSPDDALESVRAAILVGAVLPQMEGEARSLAHDLGELVRVHHAMAQERDGMTHDLAALSDDRQRMGQLIDERQKKLTETQTALDGERQHAIALARQADTLKDLVAKLDKEGPPRTPDSAGPPTGGPRDPARLTPAIAFAAAKGALPLPVSGVKIRDFGSPDGLGGTEKGLWIASRAGAQVTAPCDGWVVYAGPFRSYGQLLILNAGGGYHVLLAGMERISVDLGQFVLTGEPVAVMGGGAQSAAAVAIGSNQPVLYVEFRKDGTPVDPSPWWATTDNEKVRG
jgi:septal ring factor EnvC (AmiA/AmiB activator)